MPADLAVRRGRTTPGIWHQGLLVDVAGQPLDWLGEGTTVRLWHPLGSYPAVVLRWRLWLEEHKVAQPFKQAHREVYLLTDAELRTETYSNRFAAHLLRQDTFYALCQERGWRYRAQGGFDSGDAGVARRALPGGGMHAEFLVAAEGGPDEPLGGAGLYLTIPTDQVRFVDPDGAPRPLSDISTIVFSETMREIDLF